jgi:hypothetical protein
MHKLVLTIKWSVEIKTQTYRECERLSANRWHFALDLQSAEDVNAEVEACWLQPAYEISRTS